MTRSTKAAKARHLNAARGLLDARRNAVRRDRELIVAGAAEHGTGLGSAYGSGRVDGGGLVLWCVAGG